MKEIFVNRMLLANTIHQGISNFRKMAEHQKEMSNAIGLTSSARQDFAKGHETFSNMIKEMEKLLQNLYSTDDSAVIKFEN